MSIEIMTIKDIVAITGVLWALVATVSTVMTLLILRPGRNIDSRKRRAKFLMKIASRCFIASLIPTAVGLVVICASGDVKSALGGFCVVTMIQGLGIAATLFFTGAAFEQAAQKKPNVYPF